MILRSRNAIIVLPFLLLLILLLLPLLLRLTFLSNATQLDILIEGTSGRYKKIQQLKSENTETKLKVKC